MAISRARRFAASAALFSASGALAWVVARDWHWTVNPLLLVLTASVALAGVGVALRSVLAQVASRAVAWSLFLPTAIVVGAQLATHGSPDRLAWILAATSGAALLLAHPMLHGDDARREFSPVRFRRTFLAGATAATTTALVASAAATDFAHAGGWGVAFGLGALAASLLASALGVLRMRGWGILLGAATSAAALLAAALVHGPAGVALALAAIPGAILALPIARAQLGKPDFYEARARIAEGDFDHAATPRVRIAADDDAADASEASHVDHLEQRARTGAEVG